MKVLFCINKLGSGSSIGGAERLVVDDMNEMLSRGVSVRLLTLRKESQFSLADESLLDKKDWKTIHIGSFLNIVAWFRVYSYLRKERPDVIFTHLWFSNTVIRIVGKLAGIRNIISFEHNIYDSVKTGKMYAMDRFLQKWCKKIVAVSSAVKTSLVEHGIDEKRIIVINNGIDISKYKKDPTPGFKEGLGIPEDTFTYLTIARLIEQKGIDVLIHAFAELKDHSVLLIVGTGSDEAVLKQLAQELGVSDRVRFLGARHDIPDVLSVADVFVLASRYEGLGIVVLEAMAAGKPIIISDFPAGKDMITADTDGLVVGIEDAEGLSVAMKRLSEDSDLRAKLGASAYEKVQDFSIQNHVSKILTL